MEISENSNPNLDVFQSRNFSEKMTKFGIFQKYFDQNWDVSKILTKFEIFQRIDKNEDFR